MFLIFAILLAQFNKLTSVALVLSAVVLSTIGVFLGMMIMGQAFGVVMGGIGVIANAGVIVNNNIVLIDTYDRLRSEGVAARDAILETCRERARPVVLTAVTAILGVLPIAFGVNIDFLTREVLIGAPATQWWINLSTAIVFGLGFATVLTLIVTPAALMAIENMAVRRRALGARVRQWRRRGLKDEPESIRAIRRVAAPGWQGLGPRGENPVALRLQADHVADLQLAVARRVDLDHGLAAVGLAARCRRAGSGRRRARAAPRLRGRRCRALPGSRRGGG